MRPTTKRRVVILVLVVLLGSLSLGGIYAFRQHQITAKLAADRAEGLAAFKAGDFARALDPLSRYNTKHQDDPETLFAFGKARARVEAPNNRHLTEAIGYFRRGLEIQPDNLEARHQLLDLYSATGYSTEALALADELLKKNPADITALRAKSSALTQLRKFDDALAASQKLNELAPLDTEAQARTLGLMAAVKKNPQEILDVAEKNLDKHPNDPRFVMLNGLAYHCILDDETARKWYDKAAGMTPPDAEFIKVCTDLMDDVGMFDRSQALLEQAAASGKDPKMVRMLVQRLWQNGHYPEIVKRLADLDTASANTDPHLIAYKAFSLYTLQKSAEAKPLLDSLAARKDDDVALAWSKALTARFENPDANPKDKITQYQAALVRDPGNAAIRYMMGESYARLGETELALEAWRQVVRQVPSWPTPRTQIAYLLASTGRVQMAVEEAQYAYARGQNLGSAIGLTVAFAASIDRSDDPLAVKQVLKLVTDIQQKVPGEPQTFPIYVNLLARAGQKDKAVAAVRTAIDKSYPLGTDAWLRLAAVARGQKLGIERDVLAFTEKTYGFSPRIALANAIVLSENGDKPNAGLEYLTAAAGKATSDQSTWALAVAQYREHVRDPKAHEAWAELAAKYPDDLSVQSAILDLPDNSSPWQDRKLIETTFNRVHALTGDQGMRWQLARCRWLLTGPDRQKDLAEAIVSLSTIVRGAPGLVVPRLYLAKAMEQSNNLPAAIEQLRAAVEMDQGNPNTTLDLVRLLQIEGKFSDARTYLDRTAKSAHDSNGRQRVAYYYAQQGDLDAAITLLEPSAKSANSVGADALLADLLRRKGDFDAAAKIYQSLVAREDAEPLLLMTAADFFTTHHMTAGADAALKRLHDAKLPPGRREILLASYTEKHGTTDDAARLYRDAVAAAPTEPEAWRQLVTFQIRQNHTDLAIAAAEEAAKALPDNDDIKSLKSQAVALRNSGGKRGGPDTEALIAEMSKDPRNVAAAESLQVVADIRRSNDAPDKAVLKLRRVADRYPRFLPIQIQLVRTCMEAGQFDEAANAAARAVDSFPNDPEPAKVLAAVYTASNRPAEALAAATEWRRRSIEQPAEPDLAIATAFLRLRRPAQAASTLQPYLEKAKADPDHNQMVLNLYAQTLLAESKDSEAAGLFAPLLAKSDDWRIAWLRLAPFVKTDEGTSKWIAQGAAGAPADSLPIQYEIANAWHIAGLKFNKPDWRAKAFAIVEPLTKRPDTTAAVQLLAGILAEKASTQDAAVAFYRRALQLDPNLPIAQNNLAYLLYMKGADLDEATQLAEKAVAASPRVDNLDTLARLYAKTGKRDRAIASFREILKIDADNIEAMVPTIKLLREAGQQEAARTMMARLESLLQSNNAIPASLTEDLRSLRQSSAN